MGAHAAVLFSVPVTLFSRSRETGHCHSLLAHNGGHENQSARGIVGREEPGQGYTPLTPPNVTLAYA